MRKFKLLLVVFMLTFFGVFNGIGNSNSITNIQLSPSTPSTLAFGERVEITFDYTNDTTEEVLIFVRPFTNGSKTPNYAASGSYHYPVGSGSLSAYFKITSGETTVDQIRFQMLNDDQSQVILEFFIPVEYHFQESVGYGDLPESVQSYFVLTKDSVPFYLPAGSYVQVYGSDGVNTINVEEYARLQCQNFIGENEINIEEASSEFTVYRSGATVYLNSTSGTRVEIAATETPQTLRFADGSLVLEIVAGDVMLGSQVVDETGKEIESAVDNSDTSESVF